VPESLQFLGVALACSFEPGDLQRHVYVIQGIGDQNQRIFDRV